MSNRINYPESYGQSYVSETFGATMPPSVTFERNAGQGGAPEFGATEPINESSFRPTEPMDDGPSVTTPVNEIEVDGNQVAPVVGWLVGIKGCCRGQDFRLHSEYNTVGRNPSLDVVLNDMRISGNAALQVLYDPATREFMALPGDTSTKRVAYCNGKPLVMPCTLNAYDRIQVGYDISQKDYIAELMFVPLCGEHFNWED